MIRFVLIIAFFLVNNSFAFAQSKIETAINALTKDAALAHASVSVCVMDVATGKVLNDFQPNVSLTPASSMKVMTTAAALALLGPDYQFKTTLEYDGELTADGTLNGNLYIKGYGDPTLASPIFEAADNMEVVLRKFKKAIDEAGIKKITGRIVGDDSWLGTAGSGKTWAYEDLGNYYGAGALGLNFHENLYFLSLRQKPTLGATPPIEKVEPKIPNLLLMNELTSAAKGSGDNAFIFGAPYNYTCFVRGTIPIGSKSFTIKGAIPDPVFTAAAILMNYLEENGVETSKRATSFMEMKLEGWDNKKRATIYTHRSPSLKAIVAHTNMKSVNLYCEGMLRVMGKEKGEGGTPEAGLKVLHDFWKKKGLKTEGLFLEDGSGLSPYNALSSYHLAEVMRLIKKDENLFNAFYDSLPIAGQSGALRYRLKGTKAAGNLRAKSGGLNRVRSYTGLAKNAAGQWVSFAMIVNNYKGTSKTTLIRLEQLMKSICE